MLENVSEQFTDTILNRRQPLRVLFHVQESRDIADDTTNILLTDHLAQWEKSARLGKRTYLRATFNSQMMKKLHSSRVSSLPPYVLHFDSSAMTLPIFTPRRDHG